MILNKSQAEAVYSTMCALNNVGGRLAQTQIGLIVVHSNCNGSVSLLDYTTDNYRYEDYANRDAFASAYGLI